MSDLEVVPLSIDAPSIFESVRPSLSSLLSLVLWHAIQLNGTGHAVQLNGTGHSVELNSTGHAVQLNGTRIYDNLLHSSFQHFNP